MIKSKFVCVMEKNATTDANEITVGEIRSLTTAELRIAEGAAFFIRSYAINGNFAGYLFHGATGPINPDLSLELIKSEKKQNATVQNHTGESDKPFIYRGNLSKKELLKWLHKAVSALESEEATRLRLVALKDDIELVQSWVKNNDDFISSSVYPKHQDPIQNQDMLGNAPCKNEFHNRQNENDS
ncbi:TPA: hypothetical protein ACSTLW_000714 [Serratia fonticola]